MISSNLARIVAICVSIALQAPGGAAAAKSSKQLLAQGAALYHEGRLAPALALLDRALKRQRAEQLNPGARVDARTAGRIQLYRGLCHALSGRQSQARAAFGEALTLHPLLRLPPDRFKPELVQLLEQVRGTMRSTLEVSVKQGRARVLVDGTARGTTPLSLMLPVGRHLVVVVNQRDRETITRKVVLALGRVTRLELRFKAAPPAAARRPKPRPRPAAAPTRIWTWVAAGAAAAAVLTGGLVWSSAESDYQDLLVDFAGLKTAGEHDTIEQRRDEIGDQDVAATVLFCVAGALAVTSVVLFFVEGRPAERKRRSMSPWSARVVPVAGPTSGLVLVTQF